jgi:hypothetical protein
MPTCPSPPARLSLVLALLLMGGVGCDLPTRGPDFTLRNNLQAPLLFDKTFVFLGPSATGHEALLDTTDAVFDSLFHVQDADQAVFLVQNLSDFSFQPLQELLPAVSLPPVSASVPLGNLETQPLSARYSRTLGVYESTRQVLPALPVGETDGVFEVPVEASLFLPAPAYDLVDLGGSRGLGARLTNENGTVNAVDFVLQNGLSQPLTDGTFTSTRPPVLILEDQGLELARATFDRVPASGETAAATLDLADVALSENMRLRLDIGTPAGLAPLQANPFAVTLQTTLLPFRYAEVVVSSVPAQNRIEATSGELDLREETDFTSLVTQTGQATLHVTNTLPIPVQVTNLELENLEAVGTFPVGHVFLRTSGQTIPASSTVDIVLRLGVEGIAPRIIATLTASSAGAVGTTNLAASQGLSLVLDGEVSISQMAFRPSAEPFSSSGSFALESDEATFTRNGDYVELADGELEIRDLVNDLDLTMESVVFSVPDVLLPPYRPQDSLVIRLEGTTDNPAAYTFRRLEGNTEGTPRRITVPLANTRILPQDAAVQYHIQAVSETSSTPHLVLSTDRIRGTVALQNLRLRAVVATLDPLSANVTQDANGDGQLELMSTAEAEVTRIDALQELGERDIEGLQLRGSELVLNVTTNIAADVVLYAAILGTDTRGRTAFLSGRGPNAVAPGDTLAPSLVQNGVPIPPDRLLRVTLSGAASPDQTVTRAVVLDASNANVDAFLSTLPVEVRFVGKALLPGGPTGLQDPVQVAATLGLEIPLSISAPFTLTETVAANLTDLDRLTDTGRDTRLEGATLNLHYENRLPLGLDARFEVLDAAEQTLLVLPGTGDPGLTITAAPTDANGFSTSTQTGQASVSMEESELRLLSQGRQLRLVLTFAPPTGSAMHLRSDDTIQFRLQVLLQAVIEVGD